jgi:hypothetical protein
VVISPWKTSTTGHGCTNCVVAGCNATAVITGPGGIAELAVPVERGTATPINERHTVAMEVAKTVARNLFVILSGGSIAVIS